MVLVTSPVEVVHQSCVFDRLCLDHLEFLFFCLMQAKAKEREKELNRQFAEKERQLQENQMIVARKLGEAEHRVSTLQSGLSAFSFTDKVLSYIM